MREGKGRGSQEREGGGGERCAPCGKHSQWGPLISFSQGSFVQTPGGCGQAPSGGAQGWCGHSWALRQPVPRALPPTVLLPSWGLGFLAPPEGLRRICAGFSLSFRDPQNDRPLRGRRRGAVCSPRRLSRSPRRLAPIRLSWLPLASDTRPGAGECRPHRTAWAEWQLNPSV